MITPLQQRLDAFHPIAALGIRHLRLQACAESPEALQRAAELGLEMIAGGPCLSLVMGYRE